MRLRVNFTPRSTDPRLLTAGDFNARRLAAHASFVCLLIVCLLTAAVELASTAQAHARLKRATPAVGCTNSQAVIPTELQVWFSESVEPALSELQVLDADGVRMDKGDAHVDSIDSTQMRVTLSELKPGRYRVVWRVVSTDTHKTFGFFSFCIRAERSSD